MLTGIIMNAVLRIKLNFIPLLAKLDWLCTFVPGPEVSILPNVNRILINCTVTSSHYKLQ